MISGGDDDPLQAVNVVAQPRVFPAGSGIVQVLRDEGFEVMEAEHAQAALDILESHGRRIHVLFTDIHMPGTMDGSGPRASHLKTLA